MCSRIGATRSSARGAWEEPRIFAEIQRAGDVPEAEMEHVFNLGLGMLAIVPPDTALHAVDVCGPRSTMPGWSARSSKDTAGSAWNGSEGRRSGEPVAARTHVHCSQAGHVIRRLYQSAGSGGSQIENGRQPVANPT